MDVSHILAGLKKVKRTAEGRWVACCPAHDDKSPSMTIYDGGDKILLHCFAGCGVDAICGALGITVGDLFERREAWRPDQHDKGFAFKHGFNAMDALRCLAGEAAVIALAAADLSEGRVLSTTDADRVSLAAGRIATALEILE